jgi:serine phosphatase RsbU (regulator of sigma subunit)
MVPLNYSQNTFKLTFHANSYSNIAPTTYSYKLEGFSDEWSQWSNLNFANFEKIPEGKYTFLVKARSAYGIESEVLKIDLIVNPPWYRTIFAYVVYFIGLIFIIYFVVHLSTQRVKKQNQKLEETVQERTKEIAEQNHQLEQQKEEIVEKTKDILDSIHYAKRIQTTILPNKTRLSEMFNQHFVFYRPKDIVSGDFYWARELNDLMVFSAVDCTGHGVPGALVSIVGNNGLIRAVNEFKLTEPKDILDKLREIVVDAFQTDGNTDVKDGMDIALCTIDKKSGVLKFAGANNECLIIRNGEVIELKPDKQPIGQFIDAKPFNQHEFQLEDGDCVYMTTDGYVDQFGGERMKKFKSKPFKALLTSIYQLDMQLQYKEIQQSFDAWKGDLDQVDDVCVFAVRYKKA